MTALRAAFVRLTNTETWDEAKEKYPMYATDAQLQKFLKVDLNKSIPQTFTDFCTRATLSGVQSSDVSAGSTVHYQTYLGHVIHSRVTELNGQTIKKEYTDFKGAKLSITWFDKVCLTYMTKLMHVMVTEHYSFNIQDVSREVVESTSYTVKEINTVASCSTYSTAALCTPEVWSLVEEVWRRAYANTDVLFFANTNPRCGPGMSCICVYINSAWRRVYICMYLLWWYQYSLSTLLFCSYFDTGTPAKKLTPCVTIIVLGFFAADDRMEDEHFHFDAQEPRPNYLVGTETDLFTHLITHFSPPESTVMDLSGLHGEIYGLPLWCRAQNYVFTLSCTQHGYIHVFYCIGTLAGAVPVAALQAGRNTVCVVDSDDLFTEVLGKLSSLSTDTANWSILWLMYICSTNWMSTHGYSSCANYFCVIGWLWQFCSTVVLNWTLWDLFLSNLSTLFIYSLV